MIWKRVATAVVLIPLVVSLVLAGSTGLVAVAVALVILLAIFEYFSLGEAIGHRAYRLWTAFCAMLLVLCAISCGHGRATFAARWSGKFTAIFAILATCNPIGCGYPIYFLDRHRDPDSDYAPSAGPKLCRRRASVRPRFC